MSFEVYFEDLPLLGEKLTLWMARKCKAGLRGSNVLAVVVTDWEFSVRSLLVSIIHDADVTTTENRTLVWIVGYGELCQV